MSDQGLAGAAAPDGGTTDHAKARELLQAWIAEDATAAPDVERLIEQFTDKARELRLDAASWREASDMAGGHAARQLIRDALANEKLAAEWEAAADALSAALAREAALRDILETVKDELRAERKISMLGLLALLVTSGVLYLAGWTELSTRTVFFLTVVAVLVAAFEAAIADAKAMNDKWANEVKARRDAAARAARLEAERGPQSTGE